MVACATWRRLRFGCELHWSGAQRPVPGRGVTTETPAAGFGLVEAAGVEPASEAASSGISTSVSRILVLAWRLLPTGSASASHGRCPAPGPRRPRGGDPVFCDTAPRSAGL